MLVTPLYQLPYLLFTIAVFLIIFQITNWKRNLYNKTKKKTRFIETKPTLSLVELITILKIKFNSIEIYSSIYIGLLIYINKYMHK
jgi:hypothetical protein